MSNRLIAIRTDASKKIGYGHVMRCIALAKTLSKVGFIVEFITRNHEGNLINEIANKGFKVHSLIKPNKIQTEKNLTGYERLLGVCQSTDADEVIQVLDSSYPCCLIVDHYALDCIWEKKLKKYSDNIMVIDDLANRNHCCDLLLDQNYINDKKRYNKLLPVHAIQLLGPKYALLREDFLENKKCDHNNDEVKKVFVFFGGIDQDNLTLLVLKSLCKEELEYLLVDVVIGSNNPNKSEIEKFIQYRKNIKLYIQIENISELMCKADIAVGAGGTTTWERIALGLPSIVITLADNQISFTRDLDKDGFIDWIGNYNQVDEQVIFKALLETVRNPIKLFSRAKKNKDLVDGLGAKRVALALNSVINNSIKSKKIDNLFTITILSDRETWMLQWIVQLMTYWKDLGHNVNVVHSQSEVIKGDFCFILSFSEIVKPNILKLNKHNLVVHESNLPQGRGWSPLSWQILEGESLIYATLFEAREDVDSGLIYAQYQMKFNGDELVNELRIKQSEATVALCKKFVNEYPFILRISKEQKGKSSYYPKRTPSDSFININKSIKDQFNLFRIVDNNKYPAYFEMNGFRYEIRIKKSNL